MAQRIVPERDLAEVLRGLRELRLRHLQGNLDPWAFRQGLIIVEELDRVGALEKGAKPQSLDSFDAKVREDAKRWAQEAMAL
jgi:hypothetical protein